MKSIILLSGGLDSAVNLAKAKKETDVVLALTIDYGQRAVVQEIKSSAQLCNFYQVEHHIVKLPFLGAITKTALVADTKTVPTLADIELDDLEVCHDTAQKVWVPNRNGLFINIAAAYAESYGADLIITGFNKEEATTFPDNSVEFVHSVNQSLVFSTMNQIELLSYTIGLDKVEIVRLGHQLGLPFQYIWSCYHGGVAPCGSCESCKRLERALGKAGVKIC